MRSDVSYAAARNLLSAVPVLCLESRKTLFPRCRMLLLKGAVSRTAALALAFAPLLGGAQAASPALAPQFTHTHTEDWINSSPLTWAQLRGRVVLIEFWAFDCINCLHSAAWVESVAKQDAAAGLTVIGVHTPELSEERLGANVRDAVKRLGITYPVMIDGDYSYWNAFKNQYWPAFYLIGRDGRVRAQAIGEMHAGDSDASQFDLAIKQVLAAGN
jgi:thiol-disulfide isomerase/thioredoxin